MKKYLALLLAVVMVLALGACGVSTEQAAAPAASAAPAESTESAAPAASAGKGVRLFNGKIEIATPLEEAAKAYEAATGKHVEVESLGGGVDLQATLKQYYQAGNMPDIFVFEGKPDLANWTGMVVDMSDQPWAKDTEAGFVDESGALVGFPYTTEAIGLAYNKSILEKAGVDPKSITGPESMKAAFEAIDAKKDELGITAVIGYCANATELYWSTGQHLFGNYLDAGLARDDTTYFDMLMDGGKLDLDRFTPFAEMVGLFNQYSDPALLVSGNYDMQVSGFASGKYAFVTQGSWIGSSLTNDYKDQYASAGNFECGYVPYAFIEGIDTIERARELTNCNVFFPRCLADNGDDQLSWAQIVGFRLLDADHNNKVIGEIRAVDDSTQNVLFDVTTSEGRSLLVPAAEEFMRDVDTQRREIHVSLPEGLLTL